MFSRYLQFIYSMVVVILILTHIGILLFLLSQFSDCQKKGWKRVWTFLNGAAAPDLEVLVPSLSVLTWCPVCGG